MHKRVYSILGLPHYLLSLTECLRCTETKSHLCISRKELHGLSPNFHAHSCVCEQFIYSQDRSTYFLAAKSADRLWNTIRKSLTDTWMWNWDWGCAIPFLRNLLRIFGIASLQCVHCARCSTMRSSRLKPRDYPCNISTNLV
jgi:recombinational DNA repair protein (RecF pathway)